MINPGFFLKALSKILKSLHNCGFHTGIGERGSTVDILGLLKLLLLGKVDLHLYLHRNQIYCPFARSPRKRFILTSSRVSTTSRH